MTDNRLPLPQDDFLVLRSALREQAERVRRERRYLPESELLAPAPGCPECNGPADAVMWSVYAIATGEELLVNIDPCGHRFRTELPLPWITETRADGSVYSYPDEP